MHQNEEEAKAREMTERIYKAVRKSKEYKKLLKVINPLLREVEQSKTAKEFIKPYAPKLKNRSKKSGERMFLFREDSLLRDASPATLTLRAAFTYLALFETSVTNTVDLILMLLIATDHDFYVPWLRRYAKKLEHLDHASLGEKLVFLNKHNLQVISDSINKDLRNKIAHMDFDIEPDGKISVDSQKYDLMDETARLMTFLLALTAAFEDSGMPKLLEELLTH